MIGDHACLAIDHRQLTVQLAQIQCVRVLVQRNACHLRQAVGGAQNLRVAYINRLDRLAIRHDHEQQPERRIQPYIARVAGQRDTRDLLARRRVEHQKRRLSTRAPLRSAGQAHRDIHTPGRRVRSQPSGYARDSERSFQRRLRVIQAPHQT